MSVPIRTRAMWTEHRKHMAKIEPAFAIAHHQAEITYQASAAHMSQQAGDVEEPCFVEVLMGTPDPWLRTCLGNEARPVKLGWYVLTRFNRVGTLSCIMAHKRAGLAATLVLEKYLGNSAIFQMSCCGPNSAYSDAREPCVERAKIALQDISSTYGLFFGITGARTLIQEKKSYTSTLWDKEAA